MNRYHAPVLSVGKDHHQGRGNGPYYEAVINGHATTSPIRLQERVLCLSTVGGWIALTTSTIRNYSWIKKFAPEKPARSFH